MTPLKRLGLARAGAPVVPSIGVPTLYPAPKTELTKKEKTKSVAIAPNLTVFMPLKLNGDVVGYIS